MSTKLEKVTSSASSDLEPRVRRPLSSGWAKAQLIHELAVGEVPQKELAERFGVSNTAISQFKKRNAPLIEARLEKLMDEYADLWVAHKYNRLAARQSEVEDLMDMETTPRTAEVIDKLLNSAADELGELQPKNEINVQLAEYRISGIDLDRI